MKGYILLMIAIAIWTGLLLSGPVAVHASFTPWDLTALRFAASTLVALPISIARRKFEYRSARVWGLALLGGVGFSTLLSAGLILNRNPYSALAVVGFMPIPTILFSGLINSQPLSRLQRTSFIGATISMLLFFTYLLIIKGAGFRAMLGVLILVLASSVWGLYTNLLKKWEIKPEDVVFEIALLSAFVFLPIYLSLFFKSAHFESHPLLATGFGFYQGILAMLVQMYCYITAVGILGPAKVSLGVSMVPSVAISIQALVSHNAPPVLIAAAAAVLPASILFHQAWQHFNTKEAVSCPT